MYFCEIHLTMCLGSLGINKLLQIFNSLNIMKKLLFTLAALLMAGNAMADRVVTFNAAVDDMECGAAVYDEYGMLLGNYWTMSKDGVVINIFSANGSNPCEDGVYFVAYCSLPESESNISVLSELYSVDDDAPQYSRYYGGISRIEFNCSESAFYCAENLQLLRPHFYGDYSAEGSFGCYDAEDEFGFCPEFVEFGGGSTKIYTITVTLYGVEDEPVTPDIPTTRSLTVCDGEATNNYAPIYGLYYDTPNTMTQMIYPADMLTDMQGGKISELRFFCANDGGIPTELAGATIQLSLKVVDQDRYTEGAIEVIEGATVVANTTIAGGGSELVFTLDEPFEYTEGNLMIETLLTTSASFKTTTFYGVNTEYISSMYQYVWSTWAGPSMNGNNFLPQVAFTYEAGEVTPPVVPTEKTGAPTFHGYTEDGIHAYFVEILETEPSVIYYRVQYPDGTWTEWTEYEEILSFEGDGKYRIEAYAVAEGKAQSEQIAYEFVVAPRTGIDEMVAGKQVAGVRYFNLAGQEMQEANGLTIVVTTYTDGTTSTVKVVK